MTSVSPLLQCVDRRGQHQGQPNDPHARPADRNRVLQGDFGDEESEYSTESEESSTDQNATTEADTCTPLADDLQQYELMMAAYREVGKDFVVVNGILEGGLESLKPMENVPRRWPLARLTIPLQKSVEYLDRLLAGCCWEVLITRSNPVESLGSLRSAAKSLTILFAGYLAEIVAEILREVLTHPSDQLSDDENSHLLCANFWIKPIYQELLHAASRHNATITGERKRPCSGLAKVIAHQKHTKTKNQTPHTARVSDWIGGLCPADTLMVWFPAHWAPWVLHKLQQREQDYRQLQPQWFDLPVSRELEEKKKEACECLLLTEILTPGITLSTPCPSPGLTLLTWALSIFGRWFLSIFMTFGLSWEKRGCGANSLLNGSC